MSLKPTSNQRFDYESIQQHQGCVLHRQLAIVFLSKRKDVFGVSGVEQKRISSHYA